MANARSEGMTEDDRQGAEVWPRCDCGYSCRGQSLAERAEDGRRHAAEAHGIEVSAEAVVASRTGNAQEKEERRARGGAL